MKRSESWHFLRIIAAITALTFVACAILHGATEGIDVTGTCIAASVAALIYADWRARLALASEEWDEYLAEQRIDETPDPETVQAARDKLFREHAGGGIYGCD